MRKPFSKSQPETQVKSVTAEEWQRVDPILSAGEVVHVSDTGEFRVGDGVSRFSELPTSGGGGGVADNSDAPSAQLEFPPGLAYAEGVLARGSGPKNVYLLDTISTTGGQQWITSSDGGTAMTFTRPGIYTVRNTTLQIDGFLTEGETRSAYLATNKQNGDFAIPMCERFLTVTAQNATQSRVSASHSSGPAETRFFDVGDRIEVYEGGVDEVTVNYGVTIFPLLFGNVLDS